MAPLFFILSTITPGLAIAFIIGREKLTGLRPLAIAYGLGTALITFELFLYFVILRQSFSPLIIWFIGAQSLAALLFVLSQIKWNKRFNLSFARVQPLSWILGLCIAALLFFSLIQALGKPPVAFDSIAFWSMRAEILLKQGSVDFNQASPTYLSALSHNNYPWHLSLLEYWSRLINNSGGTLNLIAWLYFVSLVLLVTDFSVKRLGQTKGLALTLLLASQPLIFYHASNNYADLIVGYYVAIGLAFLFEWFDNERLSYLMLAGLFTGWTFSIKNYGSFYAGALVLGVAGIYLLRVHRFSWKKICYGATALILPILPLVLFKLLFKLNLRNTDPQQVWHPETIKQFWQALFISGNWNIWWAVFIVAGLFLVIRARKEKRLWIAWLMFAAVLVILLGVFTLTENYMWALDHTALSRAFIPLIPFSVLLLGYSFEKQTDADTTSRL